MKTIRIILINDEHLIFEGTTNESNDPNINLMKKSFYINNSKGDLIGIVSRKQVKRIIIKGEC
jgi:hypothetical protein